MHYRSIQFAKKSNVPCTSAADTATHLGPGSSASKTHHAWAYIWPVAEVHIAKDEARIAVLGVPDRPGVVHLLFQTMAKADDVVDMIVQNVATDGATEVSFTVARGDTGRDTARGRSRARARSETRGVAHDAEVAKVSVIGLGMRAHAGIRRHRDVRGHRRGRDQHPDDRDQRDLEGHRAG